MGKVLPRFRAERSGNRRTLLRMKAPGTAVLILFLALRSAAHSQETAPVWSQALGGSITGIPAPQAESVAVVLDSGDLRVFSSSGRLFWTYAAGGRLSAFISRSPEGVCYISRINGTFIAVNRVGRELWRVNLGSSLSSPALIGWDGRIFVPTGNQIFCYTGAGRLLWRKSLERPLALSPKLDKDGYLVLTLENGFLLRIDPFGNTRSLNLSAVPHSVLSIGSAGDGTCRFLVIHKNGNLELVDLGAGGSTISSWRPPLPGLDGRMGMPPLPAPPLAAVSRGREAAVFLRDGSVVMVQADTGRILWTGESHEGQTGNTGDPAAAEASMIFDERGIYVLTRSGASGFTGDGRRLWTIRLENAASLPAFSDEGILYLGAKEWTLHAYRLEERVKARKQPFYGPAPEGLYGTGNPPPSPWADFPYRFENAQIKARLERARSAINTGTLGDMEMAYTADLMELAGAASAPVISPGDPLVQIDHRVQALRLLGLFGSRETIPFLVKVFKGDMEPPVKAAAVEAIGRIGVDPDDIALPAFAGFLSSSVRTKDERILSALVTATASLCRFSGPPLSERGVKLLVILSDPPWSRSIQTQARKELKSLVR